MEVMKPYFEQNRKRALEDYGNKSATTLTSSKVDDIIPAAYYGRISHLFIQKDARIWGTFREDTSELKLNQDQSGDAENLADKTVSKTIQTGGEVFILEKEEMPHPGPMAAIFRY
jgi:hypothetical protein